jgi:hypothetical protein
MGTLFLASYEASITAKINRFHFRGDAKRRDL